MNRLLFFLFLCHSILTAEPIRPANRAAEPGRLIGWGLFQNGDEVGPTLPQGADAEGFVQVDTDDYGAWIALRSDGKALIGGQGLGWTERPLPDFGQRIVDVSIKTHWLVLLEDGTVRTGGGVGSVGNLGTLDVPAGLTDIVSVEAGGNCSAALSRSGRLHIWGRKDKFTTEVREKLANATTGVMEVVGSRGNLLWRRSNGEVRFVRSYEPEKGARLVPQLAEAQLLVAGNGLLGISASGELLAQPPFPSDLPPIGNVIRVAAGAQQRLAQLADGTWVSFGANTKGEADPKHLRGLLAFSLNGLGNQKSGFGIGIARSALAAPVLSRPVAEAEAILTELQKAEELAAKPLEDWKSKYFGALDRMVASEPAVAQLVQNEKEHALDLSRPIATPLAKFQAVFREKVPDLLHEEREQKLAALENVIEALQPLQDQLTQQQRLEDAVAVRQVRQDLIVQRATLARMPLPSSILSADAPPHPRSTQGNRTFLSIPSEQQVFSWNDPEIPGEIVILGAYEGLYPKLPRDLLRQPIAASDAVNGCWIVRAASGDFYCHGEYSRLHYGKRAQEIRGLAWARAVTRPHGFIGQERRGEFVHWGWDPQFGEPPYPDFVKSGPLRDLRAVHQSGSGNAIHRILAILPNGTVKAGGTLYDAGTSSWKLPPNLGKCRSLLGTETMDGALQEDGTVVVWGPRKETIPQTFTGLTKLEQQGGILFGLHQDGTLRLWILGSTSNPVADIPPNLDQVVDLTVGFNLALALRADGNWVGWGSNPDGILEKVDQLKGCRRVTIGGKGTERYVFGIRPKAE